MSVHSDATGAVEVRTEPDGAVVIGADPPGAAGLVYVALDGGVLAVDPMGSAQLRVSDPSGPAVEAVYGVAAAAMLRDGARIPLVDCPERDALIRLGVLRWLRDRCPVAVDRSLLTVEEHVVAARLAGLLDHGLLEWAPAVLDWARASRRIDSEVGRVPAVRELVVDALDAIEANLSPDSLLLTDVQLEAKLLRARRPPDRRAVDPLATWAVIEELGPHGGQLTGPDDGITFCGRGPVDWDRVPVTATSRAEDAVSWQIVPRAGADLLTVVVEAFPELPQSDALAVPRSLVVPPTELQAALYGRAAPLPLAVVELALRPENGALMGSAWLDRAASESLRRTELSVEVGPRGTPSPPRAEADARSAAAMRWASRGLSSLRLASLTAPAACEALRRTGVESLAAAARRYRALPDGSGTAAAAQCEALIHRVVRCEPGREFWAPDGRPEVAPAYEADPWTGPARASVAEAWYAAAPPLAQRPREF